jgi:type IV secretion system protein VirB6
MAGNVMITAFASPLDNIGQFVFFQEINSFLRDEIDYFQWNLLLQTTVRVGAFALVLMSLWITIQGYRIATGRSQMHMMGLVVDSLRNVLIVSIATSMAIGSSQLYWAITDGMSSEIAVVVSGNNGADAFQSIDKNLAVMAVSMGIIDSLDAGGNAATESSKNQAMWFTGIGIAGPAVVGAALLLLNKIALALFVGFGPMFILCLMFKQTQSLFSRWLLYGIGTVFSLAVLSVMVSITMRMIAAVAIAFAVKYEAATQLNIGEAGSINSMALQQGGLGLLMSVLMIMAPPAAASFFQATLANFAASSSFGQVGRWSTGQSEGGARPPSVGGYQQPPPTDRTLPSNDSSKRPSATFVSMPRQPTAPSSQ